MNLVFCDVDEVVLHYFCYLREQLDSKRYVLEPHGYDLKIRDVSTGEFLEQQESDFVSDEILLSVIAEQEVISGAVESLQKVAQDSEIIFLTNVRKHLFDLRKERLDRLRLPFQIVNNIGGKGRSVAGIVRDVQPKNVVVIDDSLRQLVNIRKHAPYSHLIRASLTLETQSNASNDQFIEARTWFEILAQIIAFQG